MSEARLKTVTTINGKLARGGARQVSVFDNALLYAEGLFETFLAIGQRIVFLDEHLRRLYKGAGVIGLDIPVSRDRLALWMKKTVKAHPARIKKLRLTVTAGESARWVGVQGKPQVILSASPHELPDRPFRLHVSRFRVDQQSVFRRIKTVSYAIHAAALKQARRVGCDDALLLNEKEQIAEVTSANIYWAQNGRIHTPPIDSGCLEGVTRRVVLREAKRLGYNLTETNATLADLVKADEVFISSSLKLVVGVSHIKAGRKSHTFTSGPITESLSGHFRLIVGVD